MKQLTATLVFVALMLPEAVWALPRFAARNQMECVQCHVNPTGGGMRNEYGANVFEKVWLPVASEPESWIEVSEAEREANDDEDAEAEAPLSTEVGSFSGTIFEWLSVGGDFRTAYIFIRPDPENDEPTDITSSFFLMQADLYHWFKLNQHLSFVVDVGVYSGFEAWGLIRPFDRSRDFDLLIKVGRFLPPFGVREVEHQLFTREGIGLGATDRDTGVEVSTYLGPFTLNAAITNGTLGDTAFDVSGSEDRRFEKAFAARASGRAVLGPLRTQLGGSFYFNNNVNQPNPLFSTVLPQALAANASEGLDEIRAGPFLTANLGRFTYLGDLVYVHDDLYNDSVPNIDGYASYQELSFLAMQGLDLVLTYEFKDPSTAIGDNVTHRAGVVVELFPWVFTELRAMARRSWTKDPRDTGVTDVVLFMHLFL